MRDLSPMALIVTDSDRPSPKVWQPWYLEEREGPRKELPSRNQREQRMRDRLTLENVLRHSPSPELNVVDPPAPPPSGRYCHSPRYYHSPVEGFDEDVPLDMSTKRRSPAPIQHSSVALASSPTPPPAHAGYHSRTPPPSYSHSLTPPLRPPPPPAHTSVSASCSPPPYVTCPLPPRGRPTVITCVAPRYIPAPHEFLHADPAPSAVVSAPAERSPGSLSIPPPEKLAPPPSYSVATAHLREQKSTGVPAATAIPPGAAVAGPSASDAPKISEDLFSTCRQVVLQASSTDPDIEEHFRRSLGHNYQQLFVGSPDNDSQNSDDSVDDHFAKALGDTWKKIKAGGDGGRNSKEVGGAPAIPSPSPPLSSSYTGLHKKFSVTSSSAVGHPATSMRVLRHSPPSIKGHHVPEQPPSPQQLPFKSSPDISITRVTSSSSSGTSNRTTSSSTSNSSTITRLIST